MTEKTDQLFHEARERFGAGLVIWILCNILAGRILSGPDYVVSAILLNVVVVLGTFIYTVAVPCSDTEVLDALRSFAGNWYSPAEIKAILRAKKGVPLRDNASLLRFEIAPTLTAQLSDLQQKGQIVCQLRIISAKRFIARGNRQEFEYSLRE